jgi:4-amino-4-deoxy-L-arabinose transferase-like glycosyltransferase
MSLAKPNALLMGDVGTVSRTRFSLPQPALSLHLPMLRLSGWQWPVAITALALVVRLLHLRFSAKLLLVDDAVFFDQHARRFLAAWYAFGTPDFIPRLVEATDHASLQGVVYPFFQSLVYLTVGGVHPVAVAAVQVALSTAAVGLTYLTARRAFGAVAGLTAGLITALYAPLIVSATLLLAEALLTFVQALALYLLIRGLAPGGWRARFLAGVCIGVLMLRPAFQYAGPLLFLALLVARWREARAGRRWRQVLTFSAPYLTGLLLVAAPWVALNGAVYNQYVWSRTGDAWQQVYWGIYPPNRGWWPPDSPVPPKYGVESLPNARASGQQIQERDLDYLQAAIDQVRATPLKVLATQVNKLYQAFLHPFDAYGERPVLVGGLMLPLHRTLAVLALAGLCLFWSRPAPAIVLGAGLFAVSLPFIASHVDVRYTIPPAQPAALFAGLAVAHLVAALRVSRRNRWHLIAVLLLPLLLHVLGVPVLLTLIPGLVPWYAHLFHAALMCAAFLLAGWIVGRRLVGYGPPRYKIGDTVGRRARQGYLFGVSGLVAGGVIASIYGMQALYDGDWHQWNVLLRPGQSVQQTIVLPDRWQPPAGSRAEIRLYVAASRDEGYDPVIRIDGTEVHRLGPALNNAGPLRFWEQIMVAARNKGMARAEVPQWVAVPVDLDLLRTSRVEVSLTMEPRTETQPSESWLRLWGDYPARPDTRAYDGPALHSRIQGQSEAFHKFIATNEYAIWRWTPLQSLDAEAAWRPDASRVERRDLSNAPGRQTGEYRIRILVYGPNHDLVAAF